MIDVNLLLGVIAVIAVGATLLGTFALFWVTRRRRDLPDHTPALSIFKPLKGVDEGLEENLRSFFLQDYPTYQLLFCVAEFDDPAIPIVEQLMAEFPRHDAQLVVGCPPFGLNPKVESLAAMERYRKHDVILISDSNVRARPSYLRETACYLADPSVGLVTNLFAGVDEVKTGAALENLQLNGLIASGVALANVMRITCVVGKSIMMPMRVLQAIGGFAGVRNLLAEDQVIGLRVRKAGYAIRLSHHVIDNVNHHRGFRWFLNRHSRWYKIRRRLAFPAFCTEPLVNLPMIGIVWAFSGETGLAWGGLLILLALTVARDAIHSYRMRGKLPRYEHILLSPVKDLFLLPVWFDALVNDRVNWRGNRALVGQYTRLRMTRASLEARQRARRLRSRTRRSKGNPPGQASP